MTGLGSASKENEQKFPKEGTGARGNELVLNPWGVGRGAVTCAQWPEAGFAASRQRTALPLDLWQLHRSCQMTAPPSAESSYTTSPNPSFSCIQRL